jgi:hypothetical protein
VLAVQRLEARELLTGALDLSLPLVTPPDALAAGTFSSARGLGQADNSVTSVDTTKATFPDAVVDNSDRLWTDGVSPIAALASADAGVVAALFAVRATLDRTPEDGPVTDGRDAISDPSAGGTELVPAAIEFSITFPGGESSATSAYAAGTVVDDRGFDYLLSVLHASVRSAAMPGAPAAAAVALANADTSPLRVSAFRAMAPGADPAGLDATANAMLSAPRSPSVADSTSVPDADVVAPPTGTLPGTPTPREVAGAISPGELPSSSWLSEFVMPDLPLPCAPAVRQIAGNTGFWDGAASQFTSLACSMALGSTAALVTAVQGVRRWRESRRRGVPRLKMPEVMGPAELG